MSDLISVVIPSYNHNSFVGDCIASIVDQTYDNLEIIIIDDCSKDHTYEVTQQTLDKFRGRFRRVVSLRNDRNYGAPYTLNKCVSFAQGHYVTFCNSDDTFHSERISLLVNSLIGTGSKAAFSDVLVVSKEGDGILRDKLAAQIYYGSQLIETKYPSVSWAFLDRQVATSTGNLLVERDLFNLIGGFRDLKYCHDWDFFLRMIINTEPVHVSALLYNYRIHSSNSFSELSHVATTETIECLSEYFKHVKTKDTPNAKAPSSINWPDTFNYYLDRCEGGWIYKRLYNNYEAHFRTVDDRRTFEYERCKKITRSIKSRRAV